MKKLMMAMGLLVLGSVGVGCDSEPEGSCITSEITSGDHGYSYSHQVCREDVTESACAASSGQFDDGGDCVLFTIIRLPTVGVGD